MSHCYVNGVKALCYHCGKSEVVMPNDVDVVVKLTKEFARIHKNCPMSDAGARLFLDQPEAARKTPANSNAARPKA